MQFRTFKAITFPSHSEVQISYAPIKMFNNIPRILWEETARAVQGDIMRWWYTNVYNGNNISLE